MQHGSKSGRLGPQEANLPPAGPHLGLQQMPKPELRGVTAFPAGHGNGAMPETMPICQRNPSLYGSDFSEEVPKAGPAAHQEGEPRHAYPVAAGAPTPSLAGSSSSRNPRTRLVSNPGGATTRVRGISGMEGEVLSALGLKHKYPDAPILDLNKVGDWFQAFPVFLDDLEQNFGTLREAAKIDLLEKALPEVGKTYIRTLKEKQRKETGSAGVKFDEAWRWVVHRLHPKDMERYTMNQIKNLKPENPGRIDSVGWLSYMTK